MNLIPSIFEAWPRQIPTLINVSFLLITKKIGNFKNLMAFTKCRIKITFKEAVEMLKKEVISLKEHIHINRRQVKAYQDQTGLIYVDPDVVTLIEKEASVGQGCPLADTCAKDVVNPS